MFNMKILFVLVASLTFVISCGKKKDEKAKGGGKSGGIALKTKTHDLKSMKITVDVPDWKVKDFNGSSWYQKGTSMTGISSLFVGQTCQGACSTVAKNIKEHAKQQVKSYSTSYKDVKLVMDEATKTGQKFYITAKYMGKDVHHYEVYYYGKDYKEAGFCRAMLMGDEIKNIGDFKKAFAKAKVELKKK
jgi:hypothetical protein